MVRRKRGDGNGEEVEHKKTIAEMKNELAAAAREEYVHRLLHPAPPNNRPDMVDKMADAYREGFLDCLSVLIKHGFIR